MDVLSLMMSGKCYQIWHWLFQNDHAHQTGATSYTKSAALSLVVIAESQVIHRHKIKSGTTMNNRIFLSDELNEMCRKAFVFVLLSCVLVALINIAFVYYADSLDEYDDYTTIFIQQFNLDDEANIATWISSMLLLLASIGCLVLSAIRSTLHPRVSKLLIVMGLGFAFLSMDDFTDLHGYAEGIVSGESLFDEEADLEDIGEELLAFDNLENVHSYAEDLIDEVAVDEVAEEIDDALGPLFTAFLAAVFVLIFCVIFVAFAAITEFVYHRTSCEEDWCFQLSTLFEENFEVVAILFFLAYLRHEIFVKNPTTP